MNRIVKLSFAVLLAAAALSSCKEKEEEIVVVRAIEVSPKTLEMNAGDTEALSAVITPSNATNQDITWSSSNSEVATVSEAGIVSAISGGRATITAKSGTKTGTCELVVKGPATAITIKPETLELGYAESATLTVTLEPDGYVLDNTVKWKSESPEIVSVEADASNSLIAKIKAGKTKGSVKITATTKDGKLSASSTVTVSGVSDNGMKTAEEFLAFVETAGDLMENDDVKLAADIDFAGQNIPQILSFKGTFNGQNFSIKNAVITDALFANNEGTVKNLVIDKSCKIEPISGEFAPLVLVNKGIVSGCTNNALIKYDESQNGYVLFGGLVAANTREGSVEDCVNNGNLEIGVTADNEKTLAPTVGGVVGATAGFVRNCTNNAAISHNPSTAVLAKAGVIGEFVVNTANAVNIPFQVGGVIGVFVNSDRENKVALTDRGVEGCKNTGEITVVAPCVNTAEKTACCRPYVAGIVGIMSGGYIKDCENTGKVHLNSDSGLGTVLGGNKQHFAAGIYCVNQNDYTIANGFAYPACTNCVNRGDVTLTTDSNDGYQYVGGISSQMDMEADATATGCKMIGCSNYGKILGNGYGKIRAGGLTGGTGWMENCKNYGTVELGPNVVANHNTGSFIGNLGCYVRGDKHPIINCEAYGDLVLTAPKQMAGGFLGCMGPFPTAEISGIVNCTIKAPAECSVGMFSGYCNANDDWTPGTPEHPMYVAGKIIIDGVETVLTADNYLQYCIGWDKSEPGKHDYSNCKFYNK